MKNNFNPVIKVTWWIIGICAIAIIFMLYRLLVENQDLNEWWFLVFSIPLIIVAFIFLALLYNLQKAYKQELEEIKQGAHLAHWIYREEEWSSFNKKEWIRSRKRAILIPLGCIGVFFFIGILDTEFREEVLPIAAPWVIGFLVSLSIVLLYYTHSLYRRTLTCPRVVFVGPHGVSYGGFYTTWNSATTRLGKVKLLPGEPSIMEFEIMIWGKYGSNPQPYRIPVPMGKEVEAEQVIAKLSS